MKNLLLRTDKANLAATIARLSLAILLFPHGAQKLLGWYGGYGFEGTMNFFTTVKHIPWFVGLMVIVTEFLGPFGLLAGAGTRLWSLLVIADMTGIILSSHTQYGFFVNWFGNQQGEGFEYHLVVIGLALTVLVSGGGKLSVDSLLTRKKMISF
jgi:putative oxidoreductase